MANQILPGSRVYALALQGGEEALAWIGHRSIHVVDIGDDPVTAMAALQSAPTGSYLATTSLVVDHRRLDYRSPAWAVSSLAYSRAVTGIAATWLAAWREARGDTTRAPRVREVKPEAPGEARADDRRPPSPEAP